MTIPVGFKGLLFPCECISSRPGGYSDSWAEITKNKLLLDGTKEEILNVLAQGPKTVTQIAETLSSKSTTQVVPDQTTFNRETKRNLCSFARGLKSARRTCSFTPIWAGSNTRPLVLYCGK